jgi:hypothetical protein
MGFQCEDCRTTQRALARPRPMLRVELASSVGVIPEAVQADVRANPSPQQQQRESSVPPMVRFDQSEKGEEHPREPSEDASEGVISDEKAPNWRLTTDSRLEPYPEFSREAAFMASLCRDPKFFRVSGSLGEGMGHP